ncbi:Outer membrane protein alpha precursor [Sporomusa ovata DSM 2662]|uniref:S-layer domain protein domain protein n=1 Tax=Sporomusa ovata TaxID=2378 RepID=A0A0U1KSA6_9FIRM|nr:S-layer homology domain-containing protein [Sporomusa ovata]EQB26216.1 S-layer domain-containing protein [Sporomusa ovata DSM 2662]CQR70291.1 S-layer domain protein domain protein [Sporomusa ovata]
MKKTKTLKKWMAIVPLALMSITMAGMPVFDTPVYAAVTPSFSDVPAGHWAYGAVGKLAKAGIVDGYSDKTFKGDRTMSRYEFAFIVAKAMDKFETADEANKELIDKLSSEFAGELNRLGARVTKLEEKTKITVSGDTRFRFVADDPGNGAKKLKGSDNFDFRQRVKFAGKINDNLEWTSRFATNYGNKFGNSDTAYGSTTYVDMMTVTAKNFLGMDSIRIGRNPLDVIGNGLIGKAVGVDGVLVKKQMGNVKFRAWTGNVKSDSNLGTGLGDSGNANQLTTGELGVNLADNLNFRAGYYWADISGVSTTTGGTLSGVTPTLNTNRGSFDSSKGWIASLDYKLGNCTMIADYISSNLDGVTGGLPSNPKAWAVQLTNGQGPGRKAFYSAAPFVRAGIVGDNAWMVSYRSVEAGAIPNGAGGFDTTGVGYATNPYSSFTRGTDNVNGLFLAYENVIAKNTVLSLEYQDIKIKDRGLTGLSSDSLDKTYMMKFEFFY